VYNPDSGEFKLRFMNSETLDKTDSGSMAADASADTVKAAIEGFYSEDWGTSITVEKTFRDVQDNELDSQEDEAFDHVEYMITLTKLIEGVTTADIRVITQGTEAVIEADLPEAV
jgi:hypothetical protein